jgi:hypothetical protein
MFFKTTWISLEPTNHPELIGHSPNDKLLTINFIDESSVEAIQEKANRMRSLAMFEEPYDPPEYLL